MGSGLKDRAATVRWSSRGPFSGGAFYKGGGWGLIAEASPNTVSVRRPTALVPRTRSCASRPPGGAVDGDRRWGSRPQGGAVGLECCRGAAPGRSPRPHRKWRRPGRMAAAAVAMTAASCAGAGAARSLSRFRGCLAGALLGDCVGAMYEAHDTVNLTSVLRHVQSLEPDPNSPGSERTGGQGRAHVGDAGAGAALQGRGPPGRAERTGWATGLPWAADLHGPPAARARHVSPQTSSSGHGATIPPARKPGTRASF